MMKAGAIVVLCSLRPPCTAPQLARAAFPFSPRSVPMRLMCFSFLSSSHSDEACCAFPFSPHSAPMRLVAGSAFLPLGMVNVSLGGGGCKESVFRWSYNRPDGHIYTLKGSLQGSLEPCGEPFLAFPVWLEEGKECVGRIISSHRTCRW